MQKLPIDIQAQLTLLSELHFEPKNTIYGIDDTHVYISNKACSVFKIKKERFWLDLDKLAKFHPLTQTDRIVDFFDESHAVDVLQTERVEPYPGRIKLCYFTHVNNLSEFNKPNDVECWINQTFIKELKDYDNISFKLDETLKKLLVYQDKELVQVILSHLPPPTL